MIIDKTKPEGNGFAIMAQVHKLLKATGRESEWPEVQERMMSGDYKNLCAVAEEVTYGSIQVK